MTALSQPPSSPLDSAVKRGGGLMVNNRWFVVARLDGHGDAVGGHVGTWVPKR
jgi:hypothetical protein